jgi:hypothetical protein
MKVSFLSSCIRTSFRNRKKKKKKKKNRVPFSFWEIYIVCGTKTNRALRFAGLILFRQSKRHDSLLFFFPRQGNYIYQKRIQCLPVMHKEAQMRRAISIGTDG